MPSIKATSFACWRTHSTQTKFLLTYTLSVLMQTMGNMTTRDTPRPVHSSHMFSRTKALAVKEIWIIQCLIKLMELFSFYWGWKRWNQTICTLTTELFGFYIQQCNVSSIFLAHLHTKHKVNLTISQPNRNSKIRDYCQKIEVQIVIFLL